MRLKQHRVVIPQGEPQQQAHVAFITTWLKEMIFYAEIGRLVDMTQHACLPRAEPDRQGI